MTITFTIPIEVVSEANAKDKNVYWKNGMLIKGKGIERIQTQRGTSYGYCLVHMGCKPKDNPLPGNFKITLTRIMGKRQRKYDDDNLRSAFKAIRDGIADYIGINDGSDRLDWRYGQEKGVDGKAAVRVEIESA